MAYRVLEVTLLSAKDLKRVNLISRLEVYAVVTISGDPMTRQCTQPDPYGGRHPSWNATFRFNVPAAAADAGGCLHVLLRTERARGDRDVGEVIVPLADLLAGASDPGPRPPQFASYQVHKVHRQKPRGVLYLSYGLGAVVSPPPAARAVADEPFPVVAYPVAAAPPFYPPPYAYLPPPVSLPPPPPAAGRGFEYASPARSPSSPAGYPRAAGHAALPPANGKSTGNTKLDFGMGLGAGLVGGAIGGMLAGDAMSDRAAYDSGYRAGLADGGAAMYKKPAHVPVVRGQADPNRPVV